MEATKKKCVNELSYFERFGNLPIGKMPDNNWN